MASPSVKPRAGTRGESSANPQVSHTDRIASGKLVTRGRRLQKKGDKKAAAETYLEAFHRDPHNVEAIKALGRMLVQLGQRKLALAMFEQALARNAGDFDILVALGNTATQMQMIDTALKIYYILIERLPDHFIGYNNAATALRQLERFDEGIEMLQNVIPMFPRQAELWNTLATLVNERDGLDAALVFYEEALKFNPRFSEASSNLARAYDNLGQCGKAVEVAEKAIRVKPDFTEAHHVLGTAYLSLGNLGRGWDEYEWRKHSERVDATLYTHGFPPWDGSSLKGKSIFAAAEQGIGDEMLFATCLPDIMAQADRVMIGCDWRLVPTFERSFPGAIVGRYNDIQREAQRIRHFVWLADHEPADYAIEIGSLPRYLRRSVDDFQPQPDGYLKPDPQRVAFWRRRYAELGDKPKVGIAWRSGQLTHERSREYTDIKDWAPLFEVGGAHFINLMYSECEADRAWAREQHGIDIHQWDDVDLRNDIDDVFAMIKALDLVISPGTAPGMMTVAVGQKWWPLLRIRPWWCFGTDRMPMSDQVSINIIPEGGNWTTLMESVARDFRRFAADHRK